MVGYPMSLPPNTTMRQLTNLKRPMRSFIDVLPTALPKDDVDTTKMRMLSHARTLEWVKECRSGDDKLDSEQKATIQTSVGTTTRLWIMKTARTLSKAITSTASESTILMKMPAVVGLSLEASPRLTLGSHL